MGEKGKRSIFNKTALSGVKIGALVVALVLSFVHTPASACNLTSITLVGSPVDNGDGTFTFTLNVCLAIDVSWGGTTDFTITVAGGTFTSIASIQTGNYTTSYNYCSVTCTGQLCFGTTLSGGCVSPILNGGNFLNFTGCGNSPGNWITPDDYDATCVTNPAQICQDVTFTTNGYPSTFTIDGAEDDVGPDIGLGGCLEVLTLPPQPGPPITINGCSGSFYDTGGPFNDYFNNENYEITFCSDNGGPVIITFNSFSVEPGPGFPFGPDCYDALFVYDGIGTGNFIEGWCGTGIIGPYTSTDSCLTFVFQSDGSIPFPGWDATISCPCIPPVASFASNSPQCINAGFNFTNTGSTGGGWTYNWTFPSGSPSTSTQENPGGVSWSSAGTYAVTLEICDINDPSCCAQVTQNIVVGGGPTVTASATAATCFGDCDGTVSAVGSGGTPPYTFFWDNGLDSIPNNINVCAGTYTVIIIDALGCLSQNTTQVTQPNPIDLLATPLDETCQGYCDGALWASTTGGQAPFTFTWDNGLGVGQGPFGVCPGTYTVTVVDANGCTEQNTLSSTATINPGATVAAGFTYNGNQCLTGNSFCFTNTGTTGGTYSWDFGDGIGTSTAESPCYTYGSSGTYTVTQTVTSGPCVASTSQTVNVFAEPTASIAGTDPSCNGLCDGAANLTVNGGSGPYTYVWSNSSPNEDQLALCAGPYSVTVTDANGCQVIASVTLTNPPAFAAPTVGTNASCNGVCDGTATTTPSGGTAPYTYTWDDPLFQTNATATGLCVGLASVTVTDASGCTATGSYNVTEPVAMTLTPASADATCGLPDGSVSVTVSGGTGPYTYSWTGGCITSSCTGLASGSYTVTVTDANTCSQTVVAVINDGGGGTASAVVDNNVTCFGACDGQATGSIIGGTAPFTYLWDDGLAQTTATAVGLCAGTYGILITDAGGCSSAASVVITEPPALNAAVTLTNDASCNGVCDGDATVSTSGGTGAYTYSWSPTGGTGITGTGLCAGTTYTVTVEDVNGCATTATTSITEPTAMVLTIVPTDPLCVGASDGSADLTVTGGTAPYNYLWTGSITSEDLTNIADGNYSVTVTDDNGCTATANTSITDPVPVTIAISVIDASCGLANGTACATPSGGLAPYTYAWNDTLFQTTTCALTVPGGSYGVTVTDANGCIATGNAVVNDLPGSNATALVVSNASAFSVCDGEASASMPGTAPFTYLWDDGLAQTTANAIGLCAGTYCVTVTDAVGCSDSACIIITEPNAMTIAIVTTDNNCFGDCNGTATVTVVGGSTPYTFLWTGPNSFASSSQDLIGLCAGTYDVTLTDANSISITDQVIITEPAAVTAGVTGVDVTCNGLCDGTATVVAGGGTPPYTYLWDDGFNQTTVVASVLCALGYNVTVTDAFGCMATGSVTINEPPAIVVNLTPAPATCGQADGAISAAVSNGTPAFTYTWDISCSSSGCTGLAAGTYSVTVTDADGCLGTGTGNVANTGGPTVGMTDSVNVNCFGGNDGSATAAVADGTPPYTYAWNTAPVQTTLMAAGLFSGSYCILVTDVNGCVTSVCVSLSEPPQLVAVAAGTDPSCNGGTDGLVSASVTGGIGPYTYAWTGTGGCITPICGSLGDGTYNLTVTDANGCTATSSATLVEPTVLAMLITGVDVSCGGLCDGSANVVATGGITPYTYSWSNGDIGQIADSLCAATVNLSITDANGCLAASSVVISEPTPVVVTIPSYGDIDCFGNCNGFAQSSVTGGVSPYTYSWNTSSPNDQIVGLCSGVYSVTVADNNGCTGTESVTITEPPAMTLSLTSQNVSCYGYCDGTATVTATGGVGPYFYLWDDNTFQTTMAATNLCAGPYSVVVTDSKGCSGTTTVVLIEPQEITITGTPVASTCGYQNGSACVVVTGGILPYTIQWNDPDQTIGNCIDSVYAGVYGVCLFDGNGCSFCISLTINDITGPMIDSVVTNDLLCFGDANGTATVYPSGGTLPYTFFWQNLAGDTIGLNTNILFGLSGGTYSVAVSDVNTCLFAQTFTIAEPVQIASAITSSSDALCYGDCNGSATVSVGNGTQPYTYSWVPSGGSTPNATGLCAGMNNVLIIDANGCQTNNGTLINEPTELIPFMVGTDISCNGGSDGEITVTVTGGSIPYNYQWLPGGTGTGITVSNLGAGAYTVIITDINGCDTNQTMSIIDPAPLSVTGGSTPSSCGDPNGQAYVSVNGGTPPYTYSWFDGGGIPIGQTTDTATGLIQGAYQCLIEDYNGCSFSLPVSVNDNAGPVVTYESSTDVLCFGTATGEASVNVTGTPPYSYMWEDGQQTKIATGLASGTYTVTVTDVNGCTDSVDVTINEPPEIILVMSGATTICVGGQTQLSVSVSGGVPPYSYDWDNAGYTSSSTLDVSPTDTTTYTVNVQDANGCIVSGSVEVQVYPPLVGIVSDPFICEGDDLTLTASGSGGMGVPANYVYTWLDAGKNIVFTGNPYVVQWLVTGVYTYYVALSDACPGDTTMITATVSPEPPPPVVAADAVYCFGDPMIDLNAQGQNISWYTDALLTPPPVDTGADFTPSGAVGTTTYYATQTVNGCESAPGTATVIVNPLPTAGFYPFPEEAPITNPGIVFTDTASADVVSWLWFFGDGDSAIGNLTDFFNGDTVVHIYSDSGTFVVYQIVTNSFGCKDIAVDTIEITNEYILFAPLAFTPGGDNINDYFLPRGMGISDEKFRFYVYDRWGDLIYQHDGAYSEWLGWDGKANDGKERAQQDVYVWLIRTEDLDENAHEYVGHVTLLR